MPPRGDEDTPASSEVRVVGLRSIPEITPETDIAERVIDALREARLTLLPTDVLVVTHKIISKAEGQLVDLHTVVPSPIAVAWGERWGKDPRQTEIVLRESRRIVRMDRGVIIAQTGHGFVCANAGVDASNVPGASVVCLLPRDPDASARKLREALARATGVEVAVIITDSFGRPWRNGIVNVAIGAAGLAPLADYRGRPDDHGRVMSASVMAVADELASAAELVMGKVARCPVALVRGYEYSRSETDARELVMDASMDMFR